MMRVALRALVVLGYLDAPAGSQAMEGEAVGRSPLELVSLLLAGFLFYVACSGALVGFVFRRWPRKKPVTEHRRVTEIASAVARRAKPSTDAQQARQ
jgi:hypothetical protein